MSIENSRIAWPGWETVGLIGRGSFGAVYEIQREIFDDVEKAIEAKTLARMIESFLDTLTVENRVIFIRRYWFSNTYAQIAEYVGMTEKNVSVRLTRVRKQMREYFTEREDLI